MNDTEEIIALKTLGERLAGRWGYGVSAREADAAAEGLRVIANAIRDIGIARAKMAKPVPETWTPNNGEKTT